MGGAQGRGWGGGMHPSVASGHHTHSGAALLGPPIAAVAQGESVALLSVVFVVDHPAEAVTY